MRVFQRADQTRVIETRLRDAVAELHQKLGGAMCAVELVTFEVQSSTAVIRVSGGCPDCEMTAGMFIQGIEAHLRRHVPEVEHVRVDPVPDTH
ncbi:MAG TPA: NifU family protein [Gemmatimonadaceae bacterium]